MNRLWLRFFSGLLVGWALCITLPARAASVEEVDLSLKKATAFLYSRLNNGNWEIVQTRDQKQEPYSVLGGQWGGRTALAVYALLAEGENANDPRLAPAIKFLKSADIVGTYALGVRCQVWLLMSQTDETRSLAQEDYKKLQMGYNSDACPARFLYGYLSTKKVPGQVDHSVSQFAVLGCWACAQTGLEIPTNYWDDVELRWIHDQQDDGGWLYGAKPYADHPVTQASMTAAGVASLFITQDYVHQRDGISCKGNIKNEHIDKGLKWMADHIADWTPENGWGTPSYPLPGYTLYGVERIGVASGLKYFGSVDWYKYGAEWCVRHQAGNGSWYGDDNIPNTTLCMLFLARGRAPVLINKIEYDLTQGPDAGKPGPWNQRPRDVANFARWMGKQTERDINWQAVNLDIPVEELHDAPFLYFAGDHKQALTLSPEHAEKLKQFVRQGGIILFNCDCGSFGSGNENTFAASVITLGKQLFPDYEFRDLPPDHPIYTNQQYSAARWKFKPELKGLSNGVRELMILMPNDPAKYWQLRETVGGEREVAYQCADDIVLYGTDKTNLLVKGQSFLVAPDPKVIANNTVKVGRIKYDGNWDPEPGGWTRLSAVMHNQCKLDLTVEPVELGKKFLVGYKMLHMTGTTKFDLTAAQQKQLMQFARDGGTVVIDCAGGSSEFADSAEAMLNNIFPGGLGEPLSADDDIYKMGMPKVDIHYRQFAKALLGNIRSPQIKAIKVNDRNAVYYSREDLSAGLVGEPVDGVIGYNPASSTKIMSGIILEAVK